MAQLGRRNIITIIIISATGLALILLLLYMQGSFLSKVAPGVSTLPRGANVPERNTTVVERKQVENILAWPGTVRSRTVSKIASKMTARIIKIKVGAGDQVKKGDVIAILDERDIKAQENAALAALARANAQAKRAQADAERIRSLYGKEAETREHFDAAVARAKEAQADVNQAGSIVSESRAHLADTILRAPFDAVVVKRIGEPGDMGLPGVPVVTLQTLGIRLEADVPSSWAGSFRVGMNVTVRIDNMRQTIPAQVDEISPEVEPQTRTRRIKIALPGDLDVEPGNIGWLEQACDQHEALVIPALAVQHIGQLEVVKVLSDGRQVMRHLRTGKTFGDQIEVISGLHAGETIIIGPQRTD